MKLTACASPSVLWEYMSKQKRLIYILKLIGFVSPRLAADIALRRFTTPLPIPRPEWEKELMAKGAPVVFANGTHGTVWGQSDAPLVFLVHGWQGRGAQLGKLVEPLLGMGLRVVAWDGPAHGDSSGKSANVRLFAELLGGAAEELAGKSGELLGVVAHSFGAGATTLALAKGWLRAKRVVLVAAPADLEWVVSGFSRRFRFSPAVERSFRQKLESWVGLKTSEVGIAHLAKTIDTPALVVHDEQDEDVPFADAEKIVKNWRGSKLLPLTGVGHRKILKAPAFIEAAKEFIAKAL